MTTPPVPFLVSIQNVDLSSLDFQLGVAGKGKSRSISFVEATSSFLFISSSSGTVYLFARDPPTFLLIIPFKGGKVCNISASRDETLLAVGSVRGKVSLYRMQPSASLRLRRGESPGSFQESPFGHLFDVPHHASEITEMRWSPNGKFLFIGDSQGIVSQVDVGSLEEFPRPPPSRIILKLESRILQIDCLFPFLAACTLEAAFLCQLEKEDFTRVQGVKRPAGLSFAENATSGKIVLIIGEVYSGSVLQCGMDGSLLSETKINQTGTLLQKPLVLFDPKSVQTPRSTSTEENLEMSPSVNFAPGRLFPTEDGKFLFSSSSNRIFIQSLASSSSLQLLAWVEDFNRINSLKIIGNYGFLWHGNRLAVFALTEFKLYAEQLFRVGLESVVENWVKHALDSLGYSNSSQSLHRNERAIKAFRDLLEIPPLQARSEDSESETESNGIGRFYRFVRKCVDFELEDPALKRRRRETETSDKKLKRLLKRLASDIKIKTHKKSRHTTFSIVHLLISFYTEIGVKFLQLDAEVSLLKALESSTKFLIQKRFQKMKQDLSVIDMDQFIEVNVIQPVISVTMSDASNSCELTTEKNLLFSNLYSQPSVQRHFSECFSNAESALSALAKDAILADILLLLLPLCSDHSKIYSKISSRFSDSDVSLQSFFTWTLILTFFREGSHHLPYSGLLRTLQNPPFFYKLSQDLLSSIYREVIFGPEESLREISWSFLNFLNFTVLYSQSTEIWRKEELTIAGVLFPLFPLKHAENSEIIRKMVQIFKANSGLFQAFYKACLEDGKSLELCGCNLPGELGDLEGVVPPFQRSIEVAIFSVLAEDYFRAQAENDDPETNAKMIHDFATRRGLISAYLESSVADDLYPDWIKIQMILRSGSPSALTNIPYSMENLSVLRQAIKSEEAFKQLRKCMKCGSELKQRANYRPISTDSIGLWVLDKVEGNFEIFSEIVTKSGLNSRGEFSLKFYQLLIQRRKASPLSHSRPAVKQKRSGSGVSSRSTSIKLFLQQ